MVTAYARIEDMARAGYAEKGRGFVFNAIYPDGTEPYRAYLTLQDEVGSPTRSWDKIKLRIRLAV
jgi:hypothetical protein